MIRSDLRGENSNDQNVNVDPNNPIFPNAFPDMRNQRNRYVISNRAGDAFLRQLMKDLQGTAHFGVVVTIYFIKKISD